MTDTLAPNRPKWQAEPVNDELQPAIDTYVILCRTSDIVDRYVESELNEYGLTTAQYGVLLHLMKGEPLSLTDLKNLIFRSNSALTSLIDRLERDGLVERAAHSNDRRVTTVNLTLKGRELLLKVRANHRPFLAEMMSCLSVEELEQLRVLLEKVYATVSTHECESE